MALSQDKIINYILSLDSSEQQKFFDKFEKEKKKGNKNLVQLLDYIESYVRIKYDRSRLLFNEMPKITFTDKDDLNSKRTRNKITKIVKKYKRGEYFCHICFENDDDEMRESWDIECWYPFYCFDCPSGFDKTYCNGCAHQYMQKIDGRYRCEDCFDLYNIRNKRIGKNTIPKIFKLKPTKATKAKETKATKATKATKDIKNTKTTGNSPESESKSYNKSHEKQLMKKIMEVEMEPKNDKKKIKRGRKKKNAKQIKKVEDEEEQIEQIVYNKQQEKALLKMMKRHDDEIEKMKKEKNRKKRNVLRL
jgi:hypothetical protein